MPREKILVYILYFYHYQILLIVAQTLIVPAMQKGNETARKLHIALNAINVVLFLWQIPNGIDMVLKVFEFTKWPWIIETSSVSFITNRAGILSLYQVTCITLTRKIFHPLPLWLFVSIVIVCIHVISIYDQAERNALPCNWCSSIRKK